MPNVTTIKVGNSIQAIAVNPLTNLVYAADANGSAVYVLDGSQNYAIVDKIQVKPTPYSIAINTNTNTIYVLCQDTASNFARAAGAAPLSYIEVIDGSTGQITNEIPLSSIPTQISLNENTGVLYAAGQGLWKISNNQVDLFIPNYNTAYSVAADPNTNQIFSIYLGSQYQFYLARFDGDTLDFIDQVVLALNSNGVAVNTALNVVYTTSLGNSLVQVWDPQNSPPSSVASVGTGGYPERVAVDIVNQRFYTANYFSSNVTIVDATNNTPVGPNIGVGGQPWDVAVDSIRSMVFTGNFNGTVSYFQDDTITAGQVASANEAKKVNQ